MEFEPTFAASVRHTSPVGSGIEPTDQTFTSLFTELFTTTNQITTSAADDNRLTAGKATFEIPYFVALLIFGGIGNLMVVAVYSQKKYRNSNAATHIMNLAAGDLFVLFIVVGLHISEYYRVTWPVLWRTDAQCILHRFARFVGFNITIFEMMAIAIDRYLAVCFPLKFRVHCTPEKTKMKIVLLWVIALLTAIPIVVNFATKFDVDLFDVNYIGKSPFACRVAIGFPVWYYDFKIIYVSIVLFFIPIIITAIIYVIIVVYVRRNNQKFAKMTNKDNNRLRSHWKTARTLLAVFAFYSACYVLLATYTLVQPYSPGSVSPLVKNLGLLLPYANSCMNPVVYSIVNPRFRRDFAALFCCQSSPQQPKENAKTRPNIPRSPPNPAEGSDDSAKTASTLRATGSTAAPDSSTNKEVSSASDSGVVNDALEEDYDVPI